MELTRHKLPRYLLASCVLGLLGMPTAQATLIGYSNCSGATNCYKAPDQTALPNPIKKNPNNGLLIGWDEKQNVTLTSKLYVNRVADPSASFVGTDASGYYIKPGTIVASHYFQWDPGKQLDPSTNLVSISKRTVQATIDFDSEIFAFITSDDNLAASDSILGLASLDYNTFNLRGLESSDTTTFNGDKVEIKWKANSPGDWTRLITAYSPSGVTPVPEPASLALLGLGLLGMGLARRRNDRESSPKDC